MCASPGGAMVCVSLVVAFCAVVLVVRTTTALLELRVLTVLVPAVVARAGGFVPLAPALRTVGTVVGDVDVVGALLTSCLLVLQCHAASVKSERRFPDDFVFGAATASYQIEGGWDADDKGESIWDHFTHSNPAVIVDQSNGDVAADSYHNYKRDVEIMRELGISAYRFSLSWPRILPTGFPNQVSEAGVAFYNNYINEMLKYNIQPMVTLYHWDLPQRLQDLGGWANPLIAQWFEDYARVAYEQFGDRVKFWITMNEPKAVCHHAYSASGLAPAINSSGIGEYMCSKNLAMAHARAYHVYEDDFKPSQDGQCGITINASWFLPESDSENNDLAAELYRQFEWGQYSHPIFSEEGGFPKEFSERIAAKSEAQGYPKSRLPEFTEEEKEYVRGTSDFFGLNHYTTKYVYSNASVIGVDQVPSYEDDLNVGYYTAPEWIEGQSSWRQLAGSSLGTILVKIAEMYNYPDIYVTENGLSTTTGLVDEDRVAYYRSALNGVLVALDQGVKIKGYMAWSLIDNFEWLQGFTKRFGLYEVDIEDPARPRTPRKSAFVYKEVVRTHVVDPDFEPSTSTMTIDEGH